MKKKSPKKKPADGILPNEQWLLANGHEGLVEAMRKTPASFAHIKQEPNPPAGDALAARDIDKIGELSAILGRNNDAADRGRPRPATVTPGNDEKINEKIAELSVVLAKNNGQPRLFR